ncbi:hypothetical protein N7468_006531 [Penicillium chermesinum]|uniref:Nascent polypeptide-associated complex subunit alpha-like UBA domain-containing protein n=1 Tax=Penicillium chermesinum TaxID=63820 RepID=A0A9W9TJQ3_9EURO|nr:uncharacterized protein N7468_006531 [Penicillium chermesinum]KAJ5225306.1 hypothetical protein N7468_006531 [Penicillium chermesinum]KAJ6140611.1 hypothetical protein N7470_010407 [Penicillium chermesinum]
MSDPIPSATGGPDVVEKKPPVNAEDRKAAAALSSLNENEIADSSSPKGTGAADQEALGKAMSRLEMTSGQGVKKESKQSKKKAEVKKTVKIDAADVTLLIDQLDLNKVKATELLRANDGDVVGALRAFITPVF